MRCHKIGANLKFSTYPQQLIFRVIGLGGGGETPQQCQQVLKIIVRTCVIARLTVLSRSKVMMLELWRRGEHPVYMAIRVKQS